MQCGELTAHLGVTRLYHAVKLHVARSRSPHGGFQDTVDQLAARSLIGIFSYGGPMLEKLSQSLRNSLHNLFFREDKTNPVTAQLQTHKNELSPAISITLRRRFLAFSVEFVKFAV